MTMDAKTAFIAQEAIKMAVEQTTKMIADMALSTAEKCKKLNGEETLIAFAQAINETNIELYHSEKGN